MNATTPAQQSVLDYIQSFQLAKGYPPTRAEIGQQMGTTPNAAQGHLVALQRKGRIRIEPGKGRGIRVITETETLSLPQRSPLQLQAIEVRKIWDSEGCLSVGFPDALTRLLQMIESGN